MVDTPALERQREPGAVRLGLAISDWTERWFPDAFIFALVGIVIVFVAGLLLGRSPAHMTLYFGGGFWSLIPFTMQMALIVIFGYVVASSPPVYRLVQRLATIPKTPRAAVAWIALFATVSSLLSWGFSLVFSGLLVREVVRRVPQTDYRAAGAAGYLGLGSVWALGLSSSAALLMATKGSIPASLLPISGVLPLSQTIFLWQSIVTAVVLMAVSVLVAYVTAPDGRTARTAESYGIRPEPLEILIVIVGVAYLVQLFASKGGGIAAGIAQALDLNTYNFIFLLAGLLLHWRPRRFLEAVTRSVPATAGVLLQFPFYAGIFGMITGTASDPSPISQWLAGLFVRVSDTNSYPILVSLYSAVLGVFVPSRGSKWVIEAPYLLQSTNGRWKKTQGGRSITKGKRINRLVSVTTTTVVALADALGETTRITRAQK